MRQRLSAAPLIGVLLVSTFAAGPATAAPASGCGMVITQSTILTADIGPCGRGGIVIAADGISVDLGGHTISGKGSTGDGVGILFDGVTDVRVSNGTVRGFDAGVAIVGGSANEVIRLTIRDNIGSLKASRPAYGDGVVIQSSSSNWIFQNTVTNNGPFGGVSIIADTTTASDSNAIDRNTIIDNDVDRASVNENDGVRVEGPNATGTVIMNNTIIANGRDGIAVFGDQGTGFPNAGLYIRDNLVHGNGFHGMSNRKGDGIGLGAGADGGFVFENEVTGNAANGIRVGSVGGSFFANTATGNVRYPGVVGAFDLNDENPSCADNQWDANTFGTANQTCIL